MHLKTSDRSKLPVQISIRRLPKDSSDRAVFGFVVTDMTETRRIREQLRSLTHRVISAQETERGRVALELHDNITQHLCAIVFRCQALAARLPDSDAPLRKESMKLDEMLGQTAEEVERISRDLRPGLLEHLGLREVVRVASAEFKDRTGIVTKLVRANLGVLLPADIELAIYRILQEALRNVEIHSRARHVAVFLRQRKAFLQLVVRDDGIGFDPNDHSQARARTGGLGLLGMRERASYVGGTVKIKSARRCGTEIDARIPLPGGKTKESA
jgi:signal transduction histidine kinase